MVMMQVSVLVADMPYFGRVRVRKERVDAHAAVIRRGAETGDGRRRHEPKEQHGQQPEPHDV